MGQESTGSGEAFDLDGLEKSLGINKTAVPSGSTPNVTNKEHCLADVPRGNFIGKSKVKTFNFFIVSLSSPICGV